MWRFLLKALIWTIPGTIACYGIWIGLLYQNPSRDTLGLYRVMPVQCNSMIFGTSRSAQGVNPAVLEQYAPHTGKWFNFSFTLGSSPWNEAYAGAIIEKIDCSIQSDKKSTFLFFVDPWALDERRGKGSVGWFSKPWSFVCTPSLLGVLSYSQEKTNPLDVISFGSGSDFLSVFWSSLPRQILATIRKSQSFPSLQGVQSNGWLPNVSIKTKEQIRQSIEEKLKEYQTKQIGENWPDSRNVESVSKVVHHIYSTYEQYDIILIRPPVTREMYELEQQLFPKANNTFLELARLNNVGFIDANKQWANNNDFLYNDAHHLNTEGAKEFSKFLAEYLMGAGKNEH